MFKIRDYPYLAIKDQVLFPGVLCGLQLADALAREAAKAAFGSSSKTVAIFTTLVDGESGLDDLSSVGVLARIESVTRDTVEAEILERVRLRDISKVPHPIAQVELLETLARESRSSAETQDRQLRETAAKIFAKSGNSGERAAAIMEEIDEEHHLQLIDFLASALAISSRVALEILGSRTIEEAQSHLLQAQNELLSSSARPLVKTVSWHDGDSEEDDSEESVAQLRERLEELELDPEIFDRVVPELDKIDRFDPTLFEHQETLARLEGLLAYPWEVRADAGPDSESIQQILETQIYGHRQGKELLLDLFASSSSGGHLPLLIICGGPGLGQGHLARTVASALERPIETIALPSKEADKLLQGTPRGTPYGRAGAVYEAALSAASLDPVLHLVASGRLDEATAVVLSRLSNPVLGRRFHDVYLNLPIDTSQMLVMLEVASLEMVPLALRAQAVVLELEAYSPGEREEILRRHLWPAALREVGLDSESVTLGTDLVEWLIAQRAREAGVAELRQLTRTLARRLARLRAQQESFALSLPAARDCLGEAVETVRTGAALGVVAQVAFGEAEAVPFEVAALPAPHINPADWVSFDEAQKKAVALALCLGADASAHRAEESWHLVLPDGCAAEEQPHLALALALAIRSATLGAPIPKELVVLGDLGLAGELRPVKAARDKAMAAWRAGYRTVLVAAEQLLALKESLPAKVQASLQLLPASCLDDAANMVFSTSRRRCARRADAA